MKKFVPMPQEACDEIDRLRVLIREMAEVIDKWIPADNLLTGECKYLAALLARAQEMSK